MIIRRLTSLAAVLTLVSLSASGSDWPASRSDAARSGATDAAVKMPLAQIWRYESAIAPRPAWPEPGKELHRMDFDYSFQPVIAGGIVYFGSSADDTIRAIDAATGEIRWRFTVGGPVRFAPAIYKGKCYVACDDGVIYCLDAATGRVAWTFRAGPRREVMLGNGRMISRWPIRTGVLVDRGVVYFAAGMWPSEGIYVYALNATDGKVVWCNDRSGSMYIQQPHAHASAVTGVAPQGYILASRETLLVPTGRSVPAAFDRKTGKLLYYRPSESWTGGGSWCTIVGDIYFSPMRTLNRADLDAYVGEAQPRREDGLEAYDIASGDKRGSLSGKHRAVARGGVLYAVGAGEVVAIDIAAWRAGKKSGEYIKWSSPHGRGYCIVVAGQTVLVGGTESLTAFDAATGKRLWSGNVAGQVRGLAVADNRVVASTSTGAVLCFVGAGRQHKVARPRKVVVINEKPTWRHSPGQKWSALAGKIASQTGKSEGYALVIGADAAKIATALAWRTKLHIILAETDDRAAAGARQRLANTNLYGSRIAVVSQAGGKSLPMASYFADLVVVGGSASVRASELYRVLRPCGGVMYFTAPGASEIVKATGAAPGEVVGKGASLRIVRGKLPGAGEWRHQWADAGRTGIGTDQLARTPLSPLWFGGPGPDRMMSRHWASASPLSVAGRVFVAGQHHVICFDAYNGRELWTRPLPGTGKMMAAYVGSNFAADDDSVYIGIGAMCYRLDQATGVTKAVYHLPDEFTPPPASKTMPLISVKWPTTWQVLGPLPKDADALDLGRLKGIPDGVTFDKKKYTTRKLDAFNGILDFTCLYGGFGIPPLKSGQKMTRHPRGKPKIEKVAGRKVTYAFAKITCPKPGRLIIAASANWWMEWFIDGKRVYTTMAGGNKGDPTDISRHVFTVELSAGEHLLAVRTLSGVKGWSLVSSAGPHCLGMMQKRASHQTPHVGYMSMTDDAVLMSCGRHGDDDTEGRNIIALNKHDGAVKWIYRSKAIFSNTAIVLAEDKVVVLEGPSADEVARAERRGELERLNFSLVGINAASGKEEFRRRVPAWQAGRQLRYSDGVIMLGVKSAVDLTSGRVLWAKRTSSRRLALIRGDQIILEPYAYYLRTGKQLMTRHIISGREIPWRFARKHGCGVLNGSKNLLLFRSGTMGIYDFNIEGTTNFGAVRPNCSTSIIAANGLVIMPEGSSSCTCSYPFQCSLAAAPAPAGKDQWYVFDAERITAPVKAIRLNFGAPGDRRGPNGEAWLAWPRPKTSGAGPISVYVGGQSPPAFDGRPTDAVGIVGVTDRPWLYASEVTGQRQIVFDLVPRTDLLVSRCKQPPKIDAELDDACWKDAKAVMFNNRANLTTPKTTLLLRRDAKNLYVAYRRDRAMRNGRVVPVAASATSKDKQWGRDDLVSVSLGDSTGQNGLQFTLTAGGVNAAFHHASGRRYDQKWPGRWESAAALAHGGWSGEMAIGLEDLAQAGINIKKLMINIASQNTSGVGPGRISIIPSNHMWFRRLNLLRTVDVMPTVSQASYTVRLHFAQSESIKQVERVFDALIQGKHMLKGMNTLATIGEPRRAIVKTFKGVKARAHLTVNFTPTASEPSLCAIEILRED